MKVVVVRPFHLEAGAARSGGGGRGELVAPDHPTLFQQLEGAIDGRRRDLGVPAPDAAEQGFSVGMILGAEQDLGDEAALAGHPQAALAASLSNRRMRGSGRGLTGPSLAPAAPQGKGGRTGAEAGEVRGALGPLGAAGRDFGREIPGGRA